MLLWSKTLWFWFHPRWFLCSFAFGRLCLGCRVLTKYRTDPKMNDCIYNWLLSDQHSFAFSYFYRCFVFVLFCFTLVSGFLICLILFVFNENDHIWLPRLTSVNMRVWEFVHVKWTTKRATESNREWDGESLKMNAVNLQCQGVGNADTVLFVTCAVLFRRVRPFVFARFFLSLSLHTVALPVHRGMTSAVTITSLLIKCK